MNHSLSCPLSGVAGGNDGRLCVPHSFTEDSNDIGIECVQTHNEQTKKYNAKLPMYKLVMKKSGDYKFV
jgi:hypothetical protein